MTEGTGEQGNAVVAMPGLDGLPPTIEALYDSMRRDLVRLAAVMVDEVALAEEIVQDAFVNLHTNWARLSEPAAAAAYVRRSVVNAARSELRRRRRHRSRRTEGDPLPAASPETLTVAQEERQAVLAAVKRLPKRQREVVILRYWQDLSEADIAAALGISTGSVKSAASRGLDAVEKSLDRSLR
jgi:RNA polymerase sigma-70 factor (sigma-E family)